MSGFARLTAPSTRTAAIRAPSRRAVALGALAVALMPLSPARAGPTAGTNMLTTAVNAKLPTARGNLGDGPVIAAQDYGADGTGRNDASSALASACAAAATAGVPLGLSGTYKISTSPTFACDLAFPPGSMLKPDSGKTVTINGRILASDVAYIFQGAGSVVAATAPAVSVQWWGAGHGIADDATAFRAALGSNRTIHAPPAAYVFASTQTPSGISAFLPAGLIIDGYSNWTLDTYGASLQMNNSNNANATLLVQSGANWMIAGLNCLGNRTGLAPTDHNACLALANDVGFVVRDWSLSGNWGGRGSAMNGDWLVNGRIDNFYFPKVNVCFDMAFVKNFALNHGFAVGADNGGDTGPAVATTGNTHTSTTIDGLGTTTGVNVGNRVSGSGVPSGAYVTAVNSSTQVTISAATTSSLTGTGITFGTDGDKCVSNVYDTANSANNTTGYSFTDTDGYSVRDVDVSNFSTGWTVQSGNHYYFSGNYWHDNPGLGSAKGIGGYIAYNNGGSFTSVGNPPGNITVIGDRYVNNGATTAGYGIDIDNSTDSADTIGNIVVADSLFANNTNTAINAASSSFLANIRTTGNILSGAAQTTGIGANLIAARAAGNVYQATPGNPSGTTSTTGVMMGLAGSITPRSTGTVSFTITGTCLNSTSGDGSTMEVRYGTGTAPSNGTASTGSNPGNGTVNTAAAPNQGVTCSMTGIATGLVPGTTYWIDAMLKAVTGGTATLHNVSISAVEVGS